MRKKALITAAIVSIVIAGIALSTGIVKENKSKTEVNSQPSTSMSEQVEQTPETSTESEVKIIEDETNISDDGLTSSNAGGSSEPIEVEVSDDGVVADKPEPYPDEYSLITQPEDNKNSENSSESNETVIKDVGPTVDIENDPLINHDKEIKTELPELTDKDMDEFMQMVEDAGSPNIH